MKNQVKDKLLTRICFLKLHADLFPDLDRQTIPEVWHGFVIEYPKYHPVIEGKFTSRFHLIFAVSDVKETEIWENTNKESLLKTGCFKVEGTKSEEVGELTGTSAEYLAYYSLLSFVYSVDITGYNLSNELFFYHLICDHRTF